MSKTGIGIAVVVLATLLSNAAEARPRLGIGPVGVAKFAVSRVLSLGGLRHSRAYARHGHARTASRDRRTSARPWIPGPVTP